MGNRPGRAPGSPSLTRWPNRPIMTPCRAARGGMPELCRIAILPQVALSTTHRACRSCSGRWFPSESIQPRPPPRSGGRSAAISKSIPEQSGPAGQFAGQRDVFIARASVDTEGEKEASPETTKMRGGESNDLAAQIAVDVPHSCDCLVRRRMVLCAIDLAWRNADPGLGRHMAESSSHTTVRRVTHPGPVRRHWPT